MFQTTYVGAPEGSDEKFRLCDEYWGRMNEKDRKNGIQLTLGENEPKIEQVGNIVDTGNYDNPQRGRVYGTDGISPALNCEGGRVATEDSRRCDRIAVKVMPNGNIRCYDSGTDDKRGISELQITNPDNVSPTVTSTTPPKIYEQTPCNNSTKSRQGKSQ